MFYTLMLFIRIGVFMLLAMQAPFMEAVKESRREPKMMKLATAAFLGAYKYSGLMAVQERIAHWAGRNFLPILLFHRVTDDIPPDGLTVSTGFFRDVCGLLQKR